MVRPVRAGKRPCRPRGERLAELIEEGQSAWLDALGQPRKDAAVRQLVSVLPAQPVIESMRTLAGSAARVPSAPHAILGTMGELSDQRHDPGTFEPFAGRWLAPLVAVFLRSVRHPALAYDLATETLAAAWLRWDIAPSGDEAVEWLLRLAAHVLDATVERKRVPSVERRRRHRPTSRRLGVAEQQQITALAEEHIELPVAARDAADALARMAPPPHVLAELRLSGLVEADPLPDHERDRHGS